MFKNRSELQGSKWHNGIYRVENIFSTEADEPIFFDVKEPHVLNPVRYFVVRLQPSDAIFAPNQVVLHYMSKDLGKLKWADRYVIHERGFHNDVRWYTTGIAFVYDDTYSFWNKYRSSRHEPMHEAVRTLFYGADALNTKRPKQKAVFMIRSFAVDKTYKIERFAIPDWMQNFRTTTKVACEYAI